MFGAKNISDKETNYREILSVYGNLSELANLVSSMSADNSFHSFDLKKSKAIAIVDDTDSNINKVLLGNTISDSGKQNLENCIIKGTGDIKTHKYILSNIYERLNIHKTKENLLEFTKEKDYYKTSWKKENGLQYDTMINVKFKAEESAKKDPGIEGIITAQDEKGEYKPVIDGNIMLYNALDGNIAKTTKSDKNGYYSFDKKDLTVGKWYSIVFWFDEPDSRRKIWS